jgi:hypothetical protein
VYLERLRDRKTLLVCAKCDLTFPVEAPLRSREDVPRRGIPTRSRLLRPLVGKTPFKFVDGWILSRFLRKALL